MIWAFAKSTFVGALAAAAIPLALVTISLVLSMPVYLRDLSLTFAMVLWLGMWLWLIVAACSVVIGIPTTLLLKWTGNEGRSAYSWAGGVCGLGVVVVAIIVYREPGYGLVAILGAVSGAVTGRVWWTTARKPRLKAVAGLALKPHNRSN